MKVVDAAARRDVYPDIVFLLDADPKKALARIKRADAFETERFAFHRLAREGFLAQARADKRWVVLNALRPAGALHQKVWERVSMLLGRRR